MKHNKRRQAIIDYIADYSLSMGYSPTVREMMAATGLSSTSAVYYHLQAAMRDGTVTSVPGLSRTWQVTPKGR